MYKEILRNIDNVAIWPTISFVIFFTFFIMLLWYVFTADNTFMNEMSEKPLRDGSDKSNDHEPLNR
jgi:hypothetical protein